MAAGRYLPEKKTRPGSMAWVGLIWPEPISKGVEVVRLKSKFSDDITSPKLSCLVTVVDMAEAIMEGVHVGLDCLINAATPAA